MSLERDEMIRALKNITIPRLREMGFRGSFPHFRRIRGTAIDLLTFQFDRHGGGFVLEISRCPPEGITTTWGEHIPADKVTAFDLPPGQRSRLQPKQDGSTKGWFRYDQNSFLRQPARYESVARSVLPFLDKAESWWRGK